MASIQDQDRNFVGAIDAASPRNVLGEGTIARLINGRFIEGAITNGIGFDELLFDVPQKRLPASPTTYANLVGFGDVQLVAPIENISGKSIICVISGRLLKYNLEDMVVTDITPIDAQLPESSSQAPLSYIDNGGGSYGVGGYLVIFNYPNETIFVNQDGARTSNVKAYECPPARVGATAGSRLFVVSGDNILYASDPLGGYQSLAPLTFQETLDPSGSYYAQVFTIGSALDMEYVTNISRLPRYMSAAQDFLAQQLLISTKKRKYIISAAAPRDTWDQTQFISYAGSADGIAGPLASTNIGDLLMYISTGGRIKTIGQDQDRETNLSENFLDEPLGQYLCCGEDSLYYRDWYRDLDHSRSIIKFVKDRVYATVYPTMSSAIGTYGEEYYSPTHKALAIGSLDPSTKLGATANIGWEGFYDWINPIGMVTLGEDLYIVSKNEYGAIKYYKENSTKVDHHKTTIYTRGYFSSDTSRAKSILDCVLYFRRLAGGVRIIISYLVNGEWICGSDCIAKDKVHRASFRNTRCKTDAASIPLRIEIEHNGCRFELENIRVNGEAHKDQR